MSQFDPHAPRTDFESQQRNRMQGGAYRSWRVIVAAVKHQRAVAALHPVLLAERRPVRAPNEIPSVSTVFSPRSVVQVHGAHHSFPAQAVEQAVGARREGHGALRARRREDLLCIVEHRRSSVNSPARLATVNPQVRLNLDGGRR